MIQSNLIRKYKRIYGIGIFVICVNAKDPILAKFNAGPKMMSLFTSGVMLGLSVQEVADLTLSPTGLILDRLSKGDVFEGNKGFSRLTEAIRYLNHAPTLRFTKEELADIEKLFRMLGLISKTESFNKSKLISLLEDSKTRDLTGRIFKFLRNPYDDYSLLNISEEKYIKDRISLLKHSKDYRQFSKRAQKKLDELENIKENLTQEEEETLQNLREKKSLHDQVQEKINKLYDYLSGSGTLDEDIKSDLDSVNSLTSEEIKNSLKTIRSTLYASPSFVLTVDRVIQWLNDVEIVDKDYIVGVDGAKHKVITQISRLDEFSQEMANMRKLMALNQGLPNNIEEQLNFVSNFSLFIDRRLDNIGKQALGKYYSEAMPLLDKLAEFNKELRQSGTLSNTSDYAVSLHEFITNPEYNELVKQIYDKIKFAVNIYRVADEVSHYSGYLKLANLDIEGIKTISSAYKTTMDINERILPIMHLPTKYAEQTRKNILPVIYREMAQKFLRQNNYLFTIPNFEIINGRLKMQEGFTTVKLGEDNKKFVEWMQYIEFPRLLKQNPNNRFLQFLGYRSYDYNADHNTSVNLAKIYQINQKNISTLVRFDQAKKDLQDLSSYDIDKLFLYNLIAYNGQSGQLSLTDLFEDLIATNSFDIIRKYNKFIKSQEKQLVKFLSDSDIMKLIAPVVQLSELDSLNIPYVYLKRSDTTRAVLLQKTRDSNNNDPNYEDPNYEDPYYLPEEGQETENAIDEAIKNAKYSQIGNVRNIEEPIIVDDKLQIYYNGITYTLEDLKRRAKSNNFELNDDILIPRQIDGKTIKTIDFGTLNTIINDKNC